ncbi:MAG: nuclear transport factor 2 family protein [Deinococcota bacterium]
MTPLDVVNKRMHAYNQHQLDDFLATYAEDVSIFTYPDTLLGKGKDHLNMLFAEMFAEGAVEVVIHQQIVKDSYVINHETVSYNGQETEYVSIYEVRDGHIQSVRFVRD